MGYTVIAFTLSQERLDAIYREALVRLEEARKKTYEIGPDGLCKCDAGTTCPLGKCGAQMRCTRKQLIAEGIKTS